MNHNSVIDPSAGDMALSDCFFVRFVTVCFLIVCFYYYYYYKYYNYYYFYLHNTFVVLFLETARALKSSLHVRPTYQNCAVLEFNESSHTRTRAEIGRNEI